jgi:hypothetical protein
MNGILLIETCKVFVENTTPCNQRFEPIKFLIVTNFDIVTKMLCLHTIKGFKYYCKFIVNLVIFWKGSQSFDLGIR